MALTAAQICTLARQEAKCPAYTAQSGQLLNYILDDLCQNYDFDTIRKTATGAFVTSGPSTWGYAPGSGPNAMPADFLRLARTGSFYYISGVPYPLIGVTQETFDKLVQQAGFSSYPVQMYVDVSPMSAQLPANMYVWPPAAGGYIYYARYYPQMAQIAIPETSSTVPWFPNTNYLITRLAGELMKITNDQRAVLFLGDNDETTPLGAGCILRKYLDMKDDAETAPKTVMLDRQRFGPAFSRLPNTKTVGW